MVFTEGARFVVRYINQTNTSDLEESLQLQTTRRQPIGFQGGEELLLELTGHLLLSIYLAPHPGSHLIRARQSASVH
jgi:hypothetical protein